MKHLLTAIACFFAMSMSAQNIDPSQYCGTGTIWSESSQTCVGQPAPLQAYDGNLDGCVNVTDLLGLLSIFGVCEPDGQTIYWFENTSGVWPSPSGSWMNESTEFYIQDCSNDTGYYLTNDISVVFEFMMDNPDSLAWCFEEQVGFVEPVFFLDNVNGISVSDIPDFTIQGNPQSLAFQERYLMIPKSFAENDLLLELPYFYSGVGLGDESNVLINVTFSERREISYNGTEYWLYASAGLPFTWNVRCSLEY
jgi:hypothetical protein